MLSQALLRASRSGFQHPPRFRRSGSGARVPGEHPEPAAPRAAASLPLLGAEPAPNSPSVKRASAETASRRRSGSAAGWQSQACRRRGQALLIPVVRQAVGAGGGGKGQKKSLQSRPGSVPRPCTKARRRAGQPGFAERVHKHRDRLCAQASTRRSSSAR